MNLVGIECDFFTYFGFMGLNVALRQRLFYDGRQDKDKLTFTQLAWTNLVRTARLAQ